MLRDAGERASERRGALPRAPRRKRIRLSREAYALAGQVFFLTLCTARRRRVFGDARLATRAFESLLHGPLCLEADLLAVCLMPDHLHLLMAPKDTNLVTLVSRWKTYTTNLLHTMGVRGAVWQRSFYDHALRRAEDIKATAEYIVNNPVRKGMVCDWRLYPYAWHAWADSI
jgi:REP element-mobilizing transposase RayT